MFAFPLERPLPRDTVDFCDGPEALGSTQVQQYRSRWACWVASEGIRLGKFPPGSVLADDFGQADDLFDPGTRPARLSFCFEQAALPVIAIQSGADIVVRRKVSGVSTAYVWAGLSPCMIYTGLVVADTGAVDAFCFYLKAPGTKLFARAQRDNFGVEYEINPAFAGGLTLRELRKADRLFLAGANYLTLRATATDGRAVYLRTAAYPPFPQDVADLLALDATADGGELFAVVTVANAYPGDLLALDSSAEDGAYLSTVQTISAPGDLLALDSTSEDGTYTLTVIGSPTASDLLTLDSAVESGIYVEIVISTSSPGDAISLDSSVESGAYA